MSAPAERTLPIVTYPAEVLRKPASLVDQIDAQLQSTIEAMFKTMYAAPGVGLAAPQVGISQRFFVMDARPDNQPAPLAFVNPEICEREGELTWEEGCLSIPGFQAQIKRSARVLVRALDPEGKAFEREFNDFPAVIVQHEIDHLDGVLFVDHLSKTRQRLFEKDFGVDRYKWRYRRPQKSRR